MRHTIRTTTGTALALVTILTTSAVAQAATWVGGAGDDTKTGTEAADTFWGRGGADHLSGAAGDDVLLGEDGPDALFGNTGADRLHGNQDDDRLHGGPGNDLLDGGYGDDRLYADDAADAGTSVGDTVRGGPGNDTVFARDGEPDDITCGDGGRDVVVADLLDQVGGDCERIVRGQERNGEADVLAERAVEWAKAFVGLDEQQLWNLGYYQDWVRRTGNSVTSPGQPNWCGIFAHEAYFQAGRDLPNEMDYTNWLAFTTHTAFSTVQDEANIRRGDLVLMDWNGDNDPDHIGLAGKDYVAGDDNRVQVVSGNSSMDDGGPNGVDIDTNTFGQIMKVRRVN